MKKVLSLVLALALVLGSFAPAFAAENPYAEQGALLEELKVFLGADADVIGDVNLDAQLTRGELFILISRLMENGVEKDTTYATMGAITFNDVEQTDWFAAAAGWAYVEGLTSGVGNDNFGPTGAVDVQQAQTALLRALGHTGADVWKNAAELADAAGIMTDLDVDGAITKGELAALTVNTLKAEKTDGTVLATALGIDLGEEPEEPVSDELAIESVTSTNLREVEVVFNKAVDADTAEDEDNYDISTGVVAASLQDDNKTVILTVGELNNQETYSLEVEKVEDLNEEAISKTEVDFTTFDQDLPTVEEITFTGPKTFEVKFSEPLKAAAAGETVQVKTSNATLSIDSGNTGVSANNEYVVEVKLFTSLSDGKEYTITLKGFEDFAGYPNVSYKESVAYNESEDAPVATVQDATQKVVKVKFDKPVTGLTPEHFYHTFTSWTALEIYSSADLTPADAISTSDAVSTVYVEFATDGSGENPLQAGTVEFHIKAKANSSTIKDAWGNKFAGDTISLDITADRTAPEVLKVEVKSGTSIKITFNEKIGNLEDATYTLLDEDGEEIDTEITPAASADKKSVTLALGDDQEGETIVLSIEDVVDDTLYENEMDKYTETLEIGDSSFDGIDRVEYDATEQILYVIFDEEVNDTALDMDNYKVLLSTSDIESLEGPAAFFENTKTVKIELSDTENGFVDNTGKLLVADVEDLAGNTAVGFQTTVDIDTIGNVEPDYKWVDATGLDTIEVQFNQELVSVDPSEFTVSAGAITAIETENNKYGTLVTLTIDTDMAYDPATAGVTVDGSFTNTKNVFGTPAKDFAAPVVVGDYVAPSIFDADADGVADGITTVADAGGDTVEYIVVKFTELIDRASVSKYTFDVAGRTVLDAWVNNANDHTDGSIANGQYAYIKLSLTNEDPNPAATPVVTINNDINDVNNGVLTVDDWTDAEFDTVDAIAPLATSVTKGADDSEIIITFNEKMDEDTLTAINIAFTDVDGATDTISTIAVNSTDKVVTITLTGDATNTDTLDITANVKDANGNVMTLDSYTFDGTDW